MQIKFGDKLLNTTEAFEDGLYMLMEELVEMIVSQHPKEDVNFKHIQANVSNIHNQTMGIMISFSDAEHNNIFEIQTDEDGYQSAYKWYRNIMDNF